MEVIDSVCKITLCILPTQIGKTFTAISKIYSEIKQDDELGRSIHIVFTMNTLLNNKQFSKRLEDIENVYGKGSVCVFSSKYSGNYVHVKNRFELQGLCFNEETCPRVIVACGNGKRYDDGNEFLKVIENNKTNIIRAYTYYDELHKYITSSLRSKIEIIHSFNIVKGIYGLTASPDKIWEKEGFWSHLKMIHLDNFSFRNYAGYLDMKFIQNDDYEYVRQDNDPLDVLELNETEKRTIGFIKYILNKYPKILKKRSKVFIPAHTRRASHNYVRDLVTEINNDCIVVVINGIEKTLQYIDDFKIIKKINLAKDDDEISDKIFKIINKYKLYRRPIVFTGFLCVGMGQTLINEKLGPFTSAIFGQIDLPNDDIYQLFGRITGRMKEWSTYKKKTRVYCPTVIMNRCNVMETCARNMIIEHNGEIVTQDDYRMPMTLMGYIGLSAIDNNSKKIHKTNDDDIDRRFMVFDTQDAAIDYGKQILRMSFKRRKEDNDKKEKAEAPKELRTGGRNPTAEELFKRMWGLNQKNCARMVPIKGNKWCIYWRPSLIQKE